MFHSLLIVESYLSLTSYQNLLKKGNKVWLDLYLLL